MGIVEGGAGVVWLHARLSGCFLREVVYASLGSSCKDKEKMAMNPVLPKVQNYRGSKAELKKLINPEGP